jgi:hypothetical protein
MSLWSFFNNNAVIQTSNCTCILGNFGPEYSERFLIRVGTLQQNFSFSPWTHLLFAITCNYTTRHLSEKSAPDRQITFSVGQFYFFSRTWKENGKEVDSFIRTKSYLFYFLQYMLKRR